MIDTIGFHLYDKWLRNLRKGKTVDCFFYDNFYDKIAIYGIGLIGTQLYEELQNTSVQVPFAIDVAASEKMVDSLDIIVPAELRYESRNIDAIVVTPIQFFGEIEKLLLDYVRNIDIISVEQVVEYTLYR